MKPKDVFIAPGIAQSRAVVAAAAAAGIYRRDVPRAIQSIAAARVPSTTRKISAEHC
jgi:hypothetical protein